MDDITAVKAIQAVRVDADWVTSIICLFKIDYLRLARCLDELFFWK